MKAIRIKVLPPTNTKGSRFSLSAHGWPRKIYPRDGGSEKELWAVVGQYLRDLKESGVHFADGTQVVIGGLDNDEDVAVLHFDEDARGINFGISHPRGKPVDALLTPPEKRVWNNPASRKKRVSKKKAASRKKAPARKKVAVGARSRITKKPPTKRLRQRRAKNLTGPAGFFPNPAKRASYTVYALRERGGEKELLKLEHNHLVPAWADGQNFATKAAARAAVEKLREHFPSNIRAVAVAPTTDSDSKVFRELTGTLRGLGAGSRLGKK